MSVRTRRCELIDLPRIADERGNLSFVEGNKHVPFEIARVFYLYDITAGAERGGHAHGKQQQLLIAVYGSFDILVDDGYEQERVRLDRSDRGLYMDTMVWHTLESFSPGSVCMVLASTHYDESDYYHDYGEFLRAVNGGP